MLRIPNPIARPCPHCGSPTVFAEFPTGLHRVHCGTFRYKCGTSFRRRSGRAGTVDSWPGSSSDSASAA